MPAKNDPIMVANTSCVLRHEGEQIHLRRGKTRARASHPIVTEHLSLWQRIDDHVDFEVEQATKAPGEKRGGARAKTPPRGWGK
jgi:hypothetical protein